MTLHTDLFSPLDDDEYEELDAFLLALDYEDAMLDISELDGFFTAVVSGPDMVPPSEWVEVIWGDPEHAPEWESEDQFQRVFSLLIRHMNSTAATLMEAPAEFEPCFLESTLDGTDYLVVDQWCFGYMKGVMLRSHLWGVDDEQMITMLSPIAMFSSDKGWKLLQKLEESRVRHLQEQIAPAARAIHAYWLEQRSPDPTANTATTLSGSKVGRNDPCPCGSGKKYKKCCGLH